MPEFRYFEHSKRKSLAMEQVIAHLEQIRPFSPELRELLRTHLRQEKYSKRQYLSKKGEVCKKIWFIEKGVVGSFYERNHKSCCAWFMMEGDIITAVKSFFDQVRSNESVQALEDTVAWYITFEELSFIYEHFPEFERHGRLLTEKYYKLSEERLYLLHNQTAVEKYQYLIDHFPKIVQRISNTHIANYLGITLQRLSTIKSQVNWSSNV